MRTQKEEDELTFKLGVYGVIALLTLSVSAYFVALHIQEDKESSKLNCYAVNKMLNDLDSAVSSYKARGYSSTTAKKHNKKLNVALASAKEAGCFKQNLKRIKLKLMLNE